MTSNLYPIKIKTSASALEAWQDDEEASFEDHQSDCKTCDDMGYKSTCTNHVYPLLNRHKTVVEARTPEEMSFYLRSARYHGDMSDWMNDRYAFRAAIWRLYKALKTAQEGIAR